MDWFELLHASDCRLIRKRTRSGEQSTRGPGFGAGTGRAEFCVYDEVLAVGGVLVCLTNLEWIPEDDYRLECWIESGVVTESRPLSSGSLCKTKLEFAAKK